MDDSILQSIVEITRQRDLDSLEYTLVTALAKIAPASSIMLLRQTGGGCADELAVAINFVVAVDASGIPRYDLQSEPVTVSIDRHLSRCLSEARTIIYKNEAGQTRTLVPTICDKKVNGVLKIKSLQPLMSALHTTETFVEIFNNYQTLFNEIERDNLTGLLNRHAFDTKLDRLLRAQLINKQMLLGSEMVREKRYLGPDSFAWLVIIDIDHFKRVNDTYGHLFGNEIILTLSQKMREGFRDSDLLFRFGSEEFVVVLEPTIRKMAPLTLDRFRETIANCKFSQVGQITVSIGYSLLTEKTDPARVLGQADQALNYAKEHGRNCIYDYAELLKAGKITKMNVNDSVALS